MKQAAAYIRVSTKQQNGAMQEKAIREWAAAKGQKLTVYRDKFTGKTMDRPGWSKLDKAIKAGKVGALVVWKLDRLGRTTSGLTSLFDELRERKIKLVSLTDGFDLSTITGRLVADILASVAAYETEVRGERIAAGQQAAKASGKRWGGSVKGWTKLSGEQLTNIRKMYRDGTTKSAIARMATQLRISSVLMSLVTSIDCSWAWNICSHCRACFSRSLSRRYSGQHRKAVQNRNPITNPAASAARK